MRVIGIDPGLANTGFGVVERDRSGQHIRDAGVIKTAADQELGERLITIHAAVGELISQHSVDQLAIEELYFGQNVRSAFAVGQALGVVVLAAAQLQLPVGRYTPQQIKGSVCGSGRADKAQVQVMVKQLLNLPEIPRPDHAADALAVAICHINQVPLMRAIKRQTKPAASSGGGR